MSKNNERQPGIIERLTMDADHLCAQFLDLLPVILATCRKL